MHRLAFVCLMLAACESNTTFTDLPDLSVGVSFNRVVDRDDDAARPTDVTVTIGYDSTAFEEKYPEQRCAVLDVHGTFNGRELELAEPGGLVDNDCVYPTLTTVMPITPNDAAKLELFDHDGNAIRADFRAGAARIASSSDGWMFKAGQQSTIGWSSDADLREFSPANVVVNFRRADGNGFSMTADALTDRGIVFTVPQLVPVDGEGVLSISIGATYGDENIAANKCDGAPRCILFAPRAYTHSATVVK